MIKHYLAKLTVFLCCLMAGGSCFAATAAAFQSDTTGRGTKQNITGTKDTAAAVIVVKPAKDTTVKPVKDTTKPASPTSGVITVTPKKSAGDSTAAAKPAADTTKPASPTSGVITITPKKSAATDTTGRDSTVAAKADTTRPDSTAATAKPDTSGQVIVPTLDANGNDTSSRKTAADTSGTIIKPGAATGKDVVSGVVRDKNGPLPGVMVVTADSSMTTTTDEHGQFKIPAPPNTMLNFSIVGYKKTQLPVTGRQLTVQMQEDVKQLKAVEVVAVGYGTMDRKKLTSAVSSISSAQIEDNVLPSISQAIQGKAGGVQVTQKSGSPGGGLSIRVRGTTSINASSDPLYVVDGIPVNSTTNFTGATDYSLGGGTQGINILASINPSDVQSVEILKDAASSSIYGARAANGVVLITTKKGQPGKTRFNFNMYEGFSEVPNERRYKLMNTAQYQDYMRDAYSFATDADGNPLPVPDQILANSNINTDWQDQIFRKAPTRNYELSASGGSDNTQYYASVGYLRQAGTILNSDFNRLSARLNLSHQQGEKLSFNMSVNLTRAVNDRIQEENSKEGATKSGYVSPPNLPVYDADGNFVYDQVSGNRENPVAMLTLPTNKATTVRLLSSVSAQYKIIPSLALKTSFGADMSFIDEQIFMPPNGIRAFAAQGGVGAARSTTDQLWINETTLSFDKTFGDHSINAVGGASVQGSRLSYVDARRNNFPTNDIAYISSGGTVTGAYSAAEEWAIASGFARINYGYKGRYLFTANFRADGSSRFGKDNRWGYFPSFAAAWRVSDEAFMKNQHTISNLKLRASWGLTGNQNIGNYASYSLYSSGFNYMGNPGFLPNVLGDKNLKWETTRQLDIGIDLGLFNDRISILADYYHKKTSDLLVGVTIPSYNGYLSKFTNVGDIENKGFEFEISSDNLVGAFKWSTSLNMGFNRNKVLSLPQGDIFGGIGNLNIAREGLPIGSFYGWKMKGVNPETGMVDYVNSAGEIVGSDNEADRMIIGNPHPDFFGGITNTFQYKGIDLSIAGQFVYGNDIFNYNLATILGTDGYSGNQSVDLVRRWRKPGDVTDIPRPTLGDFANEAISTRFVQDGSFFRIQNVTLGYTLPDKIAKACHFAKLRIYATVQNAYVFTKYRGYDPEVSSNQGGANQGLIYGYDYGSYPQPRIYTAGVNLSF